MKYFISTILVIATVMTMDAKNPLNFYANKAEEALSIGRYEDALDYAREEISVYENNPNGYYQAAISLYALQQPGQSLSMINKAIKKSKKDKPFAAQCFLFKSELFKEMGDSVQSLNALNDGLKVDGKNLDLLTERGRLLIGSNNKAAYKDLQKLKKLAPTDPRGYVYTAYLYTDENKYNEALEEITRAITLDNTMSYSYGLRGMILQRLGQTPDWIKDCLKSYELDPESNLGVLLLVSVDSSEVREQIINEIELNRSTSNGYYKLEADLLYSWNEFLLAGKTYDEIIKLGLADPDTYYYLSDCQKRLSFIIDAYTTASDGLDRYPNELALKLVKAQIGVLAGKGAEVLGIINSLISQSPDTDALYVEKGRAFMSMGQYSDATEPFATAVMLNPSSMNKMYYGDALRLSGDVSRANNEYSDILHKAETEIVNDGLIPQYMYAMAYSGMGDVDRSILAIKELSKENPESEISYMPLIYARLGNKDDAINALDTYTKVHTWNAILDLYTYNFFILHSDPKFVKLLADNGIRTKYNEVTQLLEFVPDNAFSTYGGTSMEEVRNLLSESPTEWVNAFNKLCPVDMGIIGQITSVEFDERTQTVIYNYIVNPRFVNLKLINSNPSYKRKKEDIMMLGFISENPQIINLGVTFKYNMIASDDSNQCSFVITPSRIQDLAKTMQSQNEVDKMMLDFWIEEESLLLHDNPMTPDATVKLENNILTYTYPESEEDGTMSRIELFRTDLKKQLSNLINDVSIKNRIPIYVRQNITLIFTYKGKTTGKTIDIIFTPEELSNYLK